MPEKKEKLPMYKMDTLYVVTDEKEQPKPARKKSTAKTTPKKTTKRTAKK